jgi:hypothetical protein
MQEEQESTAQVGVQQYPTTKKTTQPTFLFCPPKLQINGKYLPSLTKSQMNQHFRHVQKSLLLQMSEIPGHSTLKSSSLQKSKHHVKTQFLRTQGNK